MFHFCFAKLDMLLGFLLKTKIPLHFQHSHQQLKVLCKKKQKTKKTYLELCGNEYCTTSKFLYLLHIFSFPTRAKSKEDSSTKNILRAFSVLSVMSSMIHQGSLEFKSPVSNLLLTCFFLFNTSDHII